MASIETEAGDQRNKKIPVQVEYGGIVYNILVNEDLHQKLNSLNMAERNSTRNSLIELVKRLKTKDMVKEDSDDEETLTYCNKCKQMVKGGHRCNQASKCMESQTDTAENPTQNEGKQEGTGSFQPVSCIWLKGPTLELVEHYNSFKDKINSGLITKKAVWDHISCKMKSSGHDFTPDQVQGRWKSLCRAYKNVKDHNNKSGNNPKHYEYEKELDKVFGDDPLIVPKLVSSSLKRKKLSIDDLENKGQVHVNADTSDNEENSDSELKRLKKSDNSTPSDKPSSSGKSSTSKPSSVLDFLKDFVKQQGEKSDKEAERREKMHNEKMEAMNKLIQAIASKK